MDTKTLITPDVEKGENFSRNKIELLSGPMDGLEFKITTKVVITIGREQKSDIYLPLDNLISRQHARINLDHGEYWLEDLGSRNGTLVGEKRLEGKVRLPLGTIFKVGASEMRLTCFLEK